ncbi:threonine/homoserine efflux transporter RhtA [Diaminobutyricimonas aerilata]|uniref:Threonine/homoserine efflux transporter RhtA n=1 Tax=Diaminobutyricimonas aerilata TaxID=1162967 RepID=A0A2M9CNG7_9MICO|nr:EamA family transporter [Diaminobutyricimonas aerilata]PJJ73453.1 threonine/homoserine efflux transporter RhtA [Diaminobutyricimonas aerilata]
MVRTTRSDGILLAVASAAAFGTSGAFVKPLLEAGWSPIAAVAARALGAAIVLAIPALVTLHGRYRNLLRAWRQVLGFGLFAVAGVQLCYFAAVQRMPVGIAIMIEHLAPVLLIAVAWIATRRAPRGVVIAGAAVSVVGLVAVLGPSGVGGIDALGLLFALGSTVGCAIYFVISASPARGVHPIALTAAAMLIGGIALLLVGATGLLPLEATTASVPLFGTTVPWFVPLAIVVLVSTAFAYATGVAAARRLGSRLASFLGLGEVIFAAVVSWLLLGEALTVVQIGGGALIIVGVALVQRGERPAEALPPRPVEPAQGRVGTAR